MDRYDDGRDDKVSDEGTTPTKELSDVGLYKKLKDWFLGDSQHSGEWRKDAERNFNFVAGDQWDETTKQQMIDEKRPPITFNLSLTVIKAVAGLEINGRMETVFYPRGTEEGDVIANEGLNGASKWMGQNCDAEDEQSNAFEDVLICGMGWTESRMDYLDEPEGKYIEEKCDPLEMYWDKSARAQNLADSRRMWRVKRMSLDEAKALAERLGCDMETLDDEDLNAAWAMGVDVAGGRLRSTREDNPTKNARLDGARDEQDDVHIVQAQWWELETYNRVANPMTGEIEELDNKALAALNEQVMAQNARMQQAMSAGMMIEGMPTEPMAVESVKLQRRVFKQAFLGGKVLWSGPCPRKDGFTLNCITGQLHKMKGTWFGLITLIRDPQMMSNKWLSTTTQILNSTAKGGIIAEKGAFGANIREAQKNYANPQAITLVEDKAISGAKIMAKPGVGIAAPYVQLVQYAVDSIWRASGMNQEILGLRDVNQPGVLEQQRKQASMTILATLFNSLRRYRKGIGRCRLFFIQNYLSDGRIIRILGENGMKAVRLMKDKTVGEYDVMVNDSPTSPNTKEQTFAMLMQLMPYMKDQLAQDPEAGVIFLEYSPLPREAVDKFKKLMLAPPSPEQQAAQQLQLAGTKAEVDKVAADAAQKKASAGKQRTGAILDLAKAAQIQAEADAQKLANTIVGNTTSGVPIIPLNDEPIIATTDIGHNLPTPPLPPIAPVNQDQDPGVPV